MGVVQQILSDSADFSSLIREITEEEVATFWEQGWVRVPNFVDPALCEEVIAHYMKWSGIRWKEWPSDPAEQAEFLAALERVMKSPELKFAIRQDDPWMFNYVTQRKFGEAAARFLKVPAIKTLSETLHIKPPASSGRGELLHWHQDFPSIPADRAENVQFWLALVPISVEMGQMIHLSGSHREPPGGMLGVTREDAETLYPEIFQKYEPSTPKPLAQGDAIFHHSLTWHCSGINQTDKVRWAMSSYRMSDRCIYTGQHNFNTNGLGLEPYKHFNHPNFPTVYP